MDPGILAAIRLLPRHKKEVEELALKNEDFRSLCSDLFDAESALQRYAPADNPESAMRHAEYRNLIDGLEAELKQLIQENKDRFNRSEKN